VTNLPKVVTQLLPQIQLSTRCATAPPTGISIELDMINPQAESISKISFGACACFIFRYNVVRTRISDGGGDVL